MDPAWNNAPRPSTERLPTNDDHLRASSREQNRVDGNRRPSATSRTCGKCGLPLSGQFVRALDNTFHLHCFTCHDCGDTVASKFFPYPEHGPNQYPLCERDYFGRLDLLCHSCGNALRGSYITALDRKYHVEHFTCSVCPTVFGASDSYYEHEGNVYCHYHYSTRFAQKCNGCQTAILKQFVEIYRNGENQHWHPECYMIHKYWNVRLAQPGDPPVANKRSLEDAADEQDRKRVRIDEEKIEEKVLWIWRTLSAYEEQSATCISDMLLHVSNGAYMEGVMSAKKFILHVDLLFTAADSLDKLLVSQASKGLSYSREAKLLCKKVVAFFTLLAKSQETGVRRLGVTQDLLSLVTGLAHYLKLLIRICLQGALKFERDAQRDDGLQVLLNTINSLDSKLESEQINEGKDTTDYVHMAADTCPICEEPVEDRCFRHSGRVFHYLCMKCESCKLDLTSNYESANWDSRDERLLCDECIGDTGYGLHGFTPVSRLQQYVHLLRVAHARLLANLRTSGALPHTSDDPNLEKYDSSSGHRMDPGQPPLLRSDTRSKSYAGRSSNEEQPNSYENTLSDIRRLRSTRMDKHLSTITSRRGRDSTVMDGHGGVQSTGPGETSRGEKQGFHVIQDKDHAGQDVSRTAFSNQDSLRLDDIPRLVAAERAKEERPNASRYARGGLGQSEPQPKLLSAHRRDTSGGQELDKLGPEAHRQKRYFSELTALEYFIVRHVAVIAMEPLLEGHFNQEELVELIDEQSKQSFWGKFSRPFKNDKKPKNVRKKGVFSVPLEILVERDGEECSDGIGPNPLKVPAFLEDAISAMKTMDMSIEGVFRKNGNIRRQKEVENAMDNSGSSEAVDLNQESPVQIAALLKRFLRNLPDPVLTSKLYRLWITTQKLESENARLRALHLCCCLLPKAHRDTMEVLFCFLSWAASFSVVDEDSGSKMDIHNLATVIAPNILYSAGKNDAMEGSFLAIEAVHQLIQYNEYMAEVPEDIQTILNDSSAFSDSAELTTKDILKRYEGFGRNGGFAHRPAAGGHGAQDSTRTRSSHGSNPVVSTVDHPAAPRHAETQIRNATGSGFNTPAATQNGFYGAPGSQYGSRDSFGANGSPSRYAGRHVAT